MIVLKLPYQFGDECYGLIKYNILYYIRLDDPERIYLLQSTDIKFSMELTKLDDPRLDMLKEFVSTI